MNVINSYIRPGIARWKRKDATIKYLKEAAISIPAIFLKSTKKTKNLFLIASGFHLEETSGPIYLLDSNQSYSNLKKILKFSNIVLLPVINQRGLKYKETDSDNYLRYNDRGINYNTRWGSSSEKCVEVTLIEKYIIQLFAKYNIVFVLSLHEDSTEFKKGYLWMNSLDLKLRSVIQNYVKNRISPKILRRLRSIGLRQGFVENDFTIVDSKDDSFENFTSTILGIPTLISEAPFGLSLIQRIFFHKTVLNSIPFKKLSNTL